MEKDRLTFDFLHERGFIATHSVGAANVIYNKWGFKLNIHGNFVYCIAEIKKELIDKVSKSIRLDSGYQMPSINYKWELLELEKLMNIDSTPLITKMSVDELKRLLPSGYNYILNKRKKYKKSRHQISYSKAMGRYVIMKGGKIVSKGYNDEEEIYFISSTLLFILENEELLPTNTSGLKFYR